MRSVTVLQAGDGAVVAFAEPVLSEAVLAELEACLDSLERGGGRTPAVLRSTHPTIFLAGAHLAEIAALDAARCTAYARRGRAVLDRLASHPAPTVAAARAVAARLAAVPPARLTLWRAFRASRSRWPAAAPAIIGSAAVP